MALDLYAGAGGLSLGMEQAGFDVLGAAEFDPVHALTHAFNFPRTPLLRTDLSTVTVEQLRSLAETGWRARGRQGRLQLDAIVGGPPCQGFSTGGLRKDDDTRNTELLNFIGFVVALRPNAFILENVAGLLENRFSELRLHVAGQLERAGYRTSGFDRARNAVDFGVPQARRRVIFAGTLGEAPELSVSGEAPIKVEDALSGLPDLETYQTLLSSDTVTLSGIDLAAYSSAGSQYARQLNGSDIHPSLKGGQRTWDRQVLTNSLRTTHTETTRQRFADTRPGEVEPVSRLFRLDPNRPARTLRAGTGSERGSHTSPRPIHPQLDRVITVREAARIHGYPDWFRFHRTNWHGHRQLGNSVPPPLAAAAGKSILDILGVDVDLPTEAGSLGNPSWLGQNRTRAVVELAKFDETFDS